MKKLLLILFISLGFTTPIKADLQSGIDAYEAQNYELAILELLPLALNDDDIAQEKLGWSYLSLYIYGVGEKGEKEDLTGETIIDLQIDRNYIDAFYWLYEARKNGNKDAESAFMFFNGPELQITIKEQAELGLPSAQYWLGQFYRQGQGVLKNPKKDFYWTEKSAQQGFAPSQYKLGLYYLIGEGVDVSLQKAAIWIDLAYENGLTNAKEVWDEYELWKHY